MLYISCVQVLFLVGVWATLQFRWLQLQHPGVMLASEKLLFATCPTVAAVVQTWAFGASTSIESTPYFLLILLSIYYYLFALPTKSSFVSKTEAVAVGGRGSFQMCILDTYESAAQAVVLVFAPAAVYLVLTCRSPELWMHMWNLMLLTSPPTLVICLCSKRDSLWWLGTSPLLPPLRPPVSTQETPDLPQHMA
ncbi:hypothetical protein CYMTET_23646 [Cymbomonas tetramitiformis]|uniref:Uncharacterized protein n=1 Tax=Cymbomonas tetramitiformis TaxID=36881 RepID=A0AAE0FXQ2_9CHLO|nr:hypothetical protein CYMTET_23646 [Cymbomonas tetramitiformis]